MAIFVEHLVFYLSVVSVVNACDNGEFTQHQGTYETCGDKLFTAFNVPSVMSCAATCQRYTHCNSFFYFDTIQECECCKFVNQASGQSTSETNFVYYTRSVIEFQYVGCFGDCVYDIASSTSNVCVFGRALPIGEVGPDYSMTKEVCYTHCLKFGLTFFGTQATAHCFCGNETYDRFGTADRCTLACRGRKTEICGGPFANSVYKNIYVC